MARQSKPKKKGGFFRGLLRAIGTLLLIALLFVAALFVYLTVTEWKPADREAAAVEGTPSRTLYTGVPVTMMTWNIGYGALGDNADFFMDGGKGVHTADVQRVTENLEGIMNEIASVTPEILFVQEIDVDSTRSHRIDELASFRRSLSAYASSFGTNYRVAFVPYPIPPLGKIDSGVATFSAYPIESSERVQLPISFSWPVRMANLKRCALISRVPVANSDKELVLVNFHLEAYDSGEGKIAQTKMLADLLNAEQAKGNYVIAGGDCNQIFSTADTTKYPAQEGKWAAGEIDVTQIAGDWQFLMDDSVPTCRSLDQPYAGADHATFQYYVIDGLIVSGNIRVDSLETVDLGFVCSDHNPVVMELTLLD